MIGGRTNTTRSNRSSVTSTNTSSLNSRARHGRESHSLEGMQNQNSSSVCPTIIPEQITQSVDRWLSLCDSSTQSRDPVDTTSGISSTPGRKASSLPLTIEPIYDFDLDGAIGIDLIKTGFRSSTETIGDYQSGLTQQHQSQLSLAKKLLEADAIFSLRNRLLKELDVTDWMFSSTKYPQQM
mmetsp:Transcript_21393/g.29445  ORF Transcript_21393/g.29445 Transcript_21393/m.29445 type:complete len:182 (-) Transcript_21393:88-633(-)